MMMMTPSIFADDNPLAQRQPRTDRLFLPRFLNEEAESRQITDEEVASSRAIFLKWAELESSGKLAGQNETQLQGHFLSEVFGQALGYKLPTASAADDAVWTLEQHEAIGNGQTPDAILGHFRKNTSRKPLVVVELKGPMIHVDRDRSNGRTAVDQCWDYLVNTDQECRWGIVSNMVSFRLYERGSTKRRYEHFSLQSLRDSAEFRRFYVMFRPKGLIEKTFHHAPLAQTLLEKTNTRQRKVGDELYETYARNRMNLIAHLHHEQKHPLDDAIEMAQRLLDRIIFIAFCEDRLLLPVNTIRKAFEKLPGFSDVTNPKWKNFKALFRFVDTGSERASIPGYNGGLFAKHAVDDLELDDEPWTNFFQAIGGYDFADEVNLDVLGRFFEQSITELEKLRQSGLFGGDREQMRQFAEMPQSAKRKRLGIYYTPPDLTSRIVHYTVDELIEERFLDCAEFHGAQRDEARTVRLPDTIEFWRDCLQIMRNLRIIDPACGSGAFLFQAYNTLELRYSEVIGRLIHLGQKDGKALQEQISHFILNENLYGVDLSPEAVEIAQLALWIRSATYGKTLATLSQNIVHGNSLVRDPSVHPDGFDWKVRFAAVFNPTTPSRSTRRQCPWTVREPGFDCVVGNPPWERIKVQEREFFSLPAPEIATATNAAQRRRLVAKLEKANPVLFQRYEFARQSAAQILSYCRKSGDYPLTGKGDINTYAVFAELALRLVSPHGRVGLLTPLGIACDLTTKDFFTTLMDNSRLIRLFDFENKKNFFPDVHASFKFSIIGFGGEKSTVDRADFLYFAHSIDEIEEPKRHIRLSAKDIRLLNPNTRTSPIFRTPRDAEITKAIYRRVPVLVDHGSPKTGNPWGVKFKTMFHQTNNAESFIDAPTLKKQGCKPVGNRWVKGKKEEYLPLYEAKMVQMYDHRAAGVVEDASNWMRQGQKESTTLVGHQNPEFIATPRYWVDRQEVCESLKGEVPGWFIGFKDITSATNQRTMIAGAVPFCGATNHFIITQTEVVSRYEACLLANLNSFILDFVTRQKICDVTLNFFIVEQLPTLSPDKYDDKCPWRRRTRLVDWISERVLKLTCTAEDMLPLAQACDFSAGSFKKEYAGRLNKWKPEERLQLMAELDAAYFILYGIDREDAAYILSTFKMTQERQSLVPGHPTLAEYILDTYDDLRAHMTEKP